MLLQEVFPGCHLNLIFDNRKMIFRAKEEEKFNREWRRAAAEKKLERMKGATRRRMFLAGRRERIRRLERASADFSDLNAFTAELELCKADGVSITHVSEQVIEADSLLTECTRCLTNDGDVLLISVVERERERTLRELVRLDSILTPSVRGKIFRLCYAKEGREFIRNEILPTISPLGVNCEEFKNCLLDDARKRSNKNIDAAVISQAIVKTLVDCRDRSDGATFLSSFRSHTHGRSLQEHQQLAAEVKQLRERCLRQELFSEDRNDSSSVTCLFKDIQERVQEGLAKSVKGELGKQPPVASSQKSKAFCNRFDVLQILTDMDSQEPPAAATPARQRKKRPQSRSTAPKLKGQSLPGQRVRRAPTRTNNIVPDKAFFERKGKVVSSRPLPPARSAGEQEGFLRAVAQNFITLMTKGSCFFFFPKNYGNLISRSHQCYSSCLCRFKMRKCFSPL